MKQIAALCALVVLMMWAYPAHAVALTFDDIPPGYAGGWTAYYQDTYAVSFSGNFGVADHSHSTWGTPHSGDNVLVSSQTPRGTMGFKRLHPAVEYLQASSIGGYFSTEPGAVLEMVAYHYNRDEVPVASVTIGAIGQSWNNMYIELISSTHSIGFIDFRPVTTDALAHFCADDITVSFVPEPSSLLALGSGLVALGGLVRRRRR